MRLVAFLMRVKPWHLGVFFLIKENKEPPNRAFLIDEFLLRLREARDFLDRHSWAAINTAVVYPKPSWTASNTAFV